MHGSSMDSGTRRKVTRHFGASDILLIKGNLTAGHGNGILLLLSLVLELEGNIPFGKNL